MPTSANSLSRIVLDTSIVLKESPRHFIIIDDLDAIADSLKNDLLSVTFLLSSRSFQISR